MTNFAHQTRSVGHFSFVSYFRLLFSLQLVCIDLEVYLAILILLIGDGIFQFRLQVQWWGFWNMYNGAVFRPGR